MSLSERRRVPTLQSRISALGVTVIAGWLIALIVGFDVILGAQVRQQADATLQARAEAAASTVVRSADSTVSVVETDSDTALDTSIWVYDGRRAIERGIGPPVVQAAADMRAAAPGSYSSTGSVRFYSMPVARDGMTIATVVASISLTPYDVATETAIVGTGLLAVLVIVGAFVVLRLAAARALRPVQTMSAQAAAWSERARPDRFGQHQRYRELGILAHNLDALLDRLAAVLRHERQLSGELSHELRTPLSRIMSEADLLLLRSPDCEAATAIRAAAESMAAILETLLSTAQLDNGRLPGICSLPAVLDGLALPTHTVTIDPDTDLVGVDGAVIVRILTPILDNAHRYADTAIAINARRLDSAIAIDVHSNGPRVAEDLHERVFEPGFRAVPDDGHDGAGLGLSLARRLARAADGDVKIIPTATGTTVRVVLPPG
jgi:signal transduction histidine kinase